MSLSRKITAVLDSMDPAALPFLAEARDDRFGLSLELTAVGPVGLAFDALNFSADAPEERTTEALRAWADRLAARVTYLMEPLVVIELDAVAGEAELRSQSPTARGELKAYYEVRLNKAGALRLSRVVFDDATRRRQPATCQMTREVLERLTDDLVATAG